jgi:putative FmdB family regulatory protein
MPLYNYKCTECDEVVEVFSSMNNKMKTIDCSSCSSVSHPCFPPQVKKENNKKKQLEFKRPRLTTVERDVDPAPEDGRDCVECGAAASWQPSCKIDRFSETFPYYDRGLGVMLNSKQERRDICKNRGLTPVDGDWDIENEYSKWDSRVEKETEDYSQYCDRLDNDPAFKDFRIQQDLGLI